MEKSRGEDVTVDQRHQQQNRKNGIQFREGTKLEAKDHLGDKWWEAKVLEVDSDGHEVLVHFIGWNGRHDEWIKMDSPRLQPFNRSSRRLSGGPASPASTAQSPVSSSAFKEFKTGEPVMALWTNSCKYPAEILSREPDGSYLVQFYDGYKKSLRGHLIRRVQPEDQQFIENCRTELAAGMKGQTNGDAKPTELRRQIERRASAESRGSRETSPDLSPPPVCEKRRERKKKFNVREVLNLKGERESRTPEPDSKSKKVSDDSDGGRNSSRMCRQSSGEDSDEKLCKSSLVQEKLSKSSDEKISKSSLSNQSNYVKDVSKDSENNVNDVEEALNSVEWDAVKKSDDVFFNDFNEHVAELDSKSYDGKDESVSDSGETLKAVKDDDDATEKKKSKALEKLERQKKVVEREIQKRRFYEGFPGSDGEECNHNNVSADSEVCLKCDKNSPIRTGKVEVDLIQPVNLSDSPSQQSTLVESVDTGSEGTPSEKENLPGRTSGLNSVNLSKVDEKNKNRVPRGSLSKEPILQDSLFPEIKGKRARKRKRFADEEPEFPVSKITKILAAKVGKKLPEARLPSTPSTKPRNSKSTKTDSSKLRTRSKSRDTALETLTPKKRKRHSDRPVKKDSKKSPPLDSPVKSKEKLVTKKTNSVVKTTNSIVKTTNSSIVKTSPSVIKSTNASAKTANSVVKMTNAVKTTNSVVKTTSPIAKAVDRAADTSLKQPSDNNIHKYLTIDFSLSPTEISKQLVEGVTIPGATEPLVMSSPKLPVGWQKKVLRRALGTSAGKWEVFIENTNGKSFKSRVELTKHFEVEKLNFNIDDFDFCLDSTLKKLRQIWKTHMSNSTNETSKQEMSEIPVSKDSSVDRGELLTNDVEKSQVVEVDDLPKVIGNSVNTVKSDDNNSEVKVSLSADKSKLSPVEKPKLSLTPVERPKLSIPPAQNSRLLAQNKGNSTVPGGAVTGNVSDTGQGVRCPLKNCNKLFRNEKLLQMHVKHYHPEYNQLVAHSPSVTDLAFHRTRLGLNFQELETGGTFQETLKKAERKVERQISKQGVAQISKPPDSIISPTTKRPITTQPTNSAPSPTIPVPKLPSPPISSPPKPTEPVESPKKTKLEKEDKKAVKKRKHSPEEGLKSPGALQPEKKVKTMLPQKKTESLGSLESVVPEGDGGLQQQQQQQQQQQGLEMEAKKATRGRPRRDTNTETPIIKLEPTPTTKTRPKRIRNDSILSVGSESTPLAHLTPPTSPPPSISTRPPPTPSTPPTYRVSKRRQLQLHGEEEKEVEEKEKEKEEEEVVNCGCGRNEEDGLMIQCDICLCWQHGLCLEIHKEEQVPEKYICAICRKPRFGRQSVLYTVDQDWLKEGRLTYLPSSPPRHSSPPAPASPPPPLTGREAEFKKLSDLMADLSSMSAVLHSLRVKLAVAGQASNPKVFMWSSPWESSAPSTPPPSQEEAWQRGAAAWETNGARQPFLFPADIPDNPGDFMAAAETQLGLKQNSLQQFQQNSLQQMQQNSFQQNSLQQNISALMQQKSDHNASLQSDIDNNTLTEQQPEVSKEVKSEAESAESSGEVKGSEKAASVNNASCDSRDAESADTSQDIAEKSVAEESCQQNQRSEDPIAAANSTNKDPAVSESSKSSEQDGKGTSEREPGSEKGIEQTSGKSGISQSPVPEVFRENSLHETDKQNEASQTNSSGGKHLNNGEILDNPTQRASKSEDNGVDETNSSDDKDLNKSSCQEREDALNCCPPSDGSTNEPNLCLSDSSFHQNESNKQVDESSSSFPASVDNSQNSFNEMNDSGQSNDDLSDYISGIKDVFDFPTNLIPSVSEVQRLLPGIIQSVTGGGLEDPNESFDRDVSSFRLPPNVIVEPKRLDREECRVNLIQHVENLQGLVEDSFDKIETRLMALESGEEVPPLHETDTHFPRAKSVLILLLRDLKTAKKLNLSLPEKI